MHMHVQVAAAAALCNMTAGNNSNKRRCGEAAAQALVSALRTHGLESSVVEAVLGALVSILPGSALAEALPNAALSAGGGSAATLAAMAAHGDNLQIQRRGLSVLLSLCKSNAEEHQALHELRARELVQATMERHAGNDRIADLVQRLLDVMQQPERGHPKRSRLLRVP